MSVAPCERCGRSLLDLRKEATRDAMKGTALLCSVPRCPLVQRVMGFPEPPRIGALELHGPSPPAVFVGRHGYPRVQVGPLLPDASQFLPAMGASHADWAKTLDIAGVLSMRARLFRSKTPVRVDATAAPHALEASRELAMAERPVETEVTLAKPARHLTDPKVDATAMPMGPSIDILDARIMAHPSVPRRVDALVSDVHADAATGVGELYDAGIGTDHIQRLLSVGLLGEGRRRKLVPTRWSITATDDILGKQMIEDVKPHTVIDAPTVHSASLFGNDFHILLLPRVWAYEMLEAWHEEGAWQFGHDHEPHGGRTDYAASVTGAYYAARLSVLEHLKAHQRQAAPFVYREITEDYWAPLGVWVIREGVRIAMEGKGLAFEDVDSAVRHILRKSRMKDWPRVAVLPRETQVQKTLRDFAV